MSEITFDLTAAPIAFDLKVSNPSFSYNVTPILLNLSFNSGGSSGGSGTVTSIATGTGLTGGPITSSGTISLLAPTASTIGGVKAGTNITIAADGTISSSGSGGSGITLDQNPPTFTNTGIVTTTAGATGATTFVVAGDQTAKFTNGTKVTFAIKATGQLYTVSSAVFSTNTTVTFAPVLLAADAFAIGASVYTVVGSSATTASITDIGFGSSMQIDVTGTAALVNLKPATSSLLGGVKIGSNITVAADGTISVATPGATKLTGLTDVSVTEPAYVDSTLTIASFTTTVITTTAAVSANIVVGDFIRGDNTTANSPLAKVTAVSGQAITIANTVGFGFANAGKIYKAASTTLDQKNLTYDLATNAWIAQAPIVYPTSYALTNLTDVVVSEPGYTNTTLTISSFTGTVITTSAAVGANVAVGDYIRGTNTSANLPLAKVTAVTGSTITLASTAGYGFTNGGSIFKAASTTIDQQQLTYDLATNAWIAKTPIASGGVVYDQNAPIFTDSLLVTTSTGVAGNTTFTVAGIVTALPVSTKLTFQATRPSGQIYTVSTVVSTTNTTITFSPALLAADAFAIGAKIYTVSGSSATQQPLTEIAFPQGFLQTYSNGALQVSYVGTAWTDPSNIGVGGQVLNAQSPQIVQAGKIGVMDGRGGFCGAGYSIQTSTNNPQYGGINIQAYYNNLYVSAFNGLYYSTDLYAQTWTPIYTVGNQIAYCTNVNGTFVVLNNTAGINYYTSTNGINWTTRSLPSSVTVLGISYTNGFLYVSSSGKLFRTSDGINWTTITFFGTTNYQVAYNGTSYFAVGSNTTNYYYSTDGVTNWTLSSTPFPSSTFIVRYLIFFAGKLIVFGQLGQTPYYVGTTGFDFVLYNTPNVLGNIVLTYSEIVDSYGGMATSDGITWDATRYSAYKGSIKSSVYNSDKNFMISGNFVTSTNNVISYDRAFVYVTASDNSNPTTTPQGQYKCLGGPTWVRTA